MLFHFDRRKKSEKEKKPPRFLVLRRKWLTLGAAVLAAAAIFAAVNYPAAVSASAAARQLPIYCVQRDQKVCSISFDAAWGADNTQKILDVLKEYGVTCTFFVVGNWADQYPEQAKAIVDSGNELMNHSNAHDHYNSLTADQIIADVNTCNDKIEALTGVRPTLIRCPFGEYDDHVISTIRSIGMEPIQWDVEELKLKGTAPSWCYAFLTNDFQQKNRASPKKSVHFAITSELLASITSMILRRMRSGIVELLLQRMHPPAFVIHIFVAFPLGVP